MICHCLHDRTEERTTLMFELCSSCQRRIFFVHGEEKCFPSVFRADGNILKLQQSFPLMTQKENEGKDSPNFHPRCFFKGIFAFLTLFKSKLCSD